MVTSGASVLLQFWLQSRARSDLDGTPQPAVHCSEKRRVHMHPAFWPMQAFVFWADVLMLPWKMMMAPMADSMNVTAAATSPAATAGLDPVSPGEIGTSATDFSKDADA